MTMLAKQRDQSIDLAKGVCILLVVVGHSLEISFLYRPDGAFSFEAFYWWRLIDAFLMQLFYFLSGAVTSRGSLIRFDKTASRCLHLILLAAVLHLMLVPLTFVFHWLAPADAVPLAELFKKVVRPLVTGRGYNSVVVWFLVSLAVVQLCAFLLFSRKPLLQAAGIAMLCVSVLMTVFDKTNYWQLRTLAPGMLFFLAGMYYRNLPHPPVWLAAGAVMGTLLLSLWATPLNQGCAFSLASNCAQTMTNGYFRVLLVAGEIGNVPVFFVTSFSGIILVCMASRLVPGNALGLGWIGRQSLPLMMINGVFLQFIHPLLKRLPPMDGYGVVAELLALLVVQIGLLWLSSGMFQRLQDEVKRLTAWALQQAAPLAAGLGVRRPV